MEQNFQLNDLLSIASEMKRINNRIKTLRMRLECVRGIDYGKDRVQGSADDIGALETIIDLIREQEKLFLARYYEITAMEAEFYRRIELLSPAQRQILELRYISGYRGVRLAMQINYSERSCYRLLQEAKRAFYKVRPKV